MQQELQIFLISAFWGMLVVFYYDFFRIWRGIKVHRIWSVVVEDIVFCLGAACLIVAVLYTYNQGQVRAFVLLGMGCGAVLYNWGISPFICGSIWYIHRKLKLILKRMMKHSKMEQKKNEKDGKDE